MHEQTLVLELLRKVESVAREHRAKARRVTIRIGPSCHISPETLRAQFSLLARGTAAEGAGVEVMVDATGALQKGREVVLESIEIEQ
jgi:Zn finger protein HypA/HybF involved in hydrogenase expression